MVEAERLEAGVVRNALLQKDRKRLSTQTITLNLIASLGA